MFVCVFMSVYVCGVHVFDCMRVTVCACMRLPVCIIDRIL